MIDVNLKGTLYTAAASLPHLIESGAGDFVSIASVAGLRAYPGESVYNASKFGQLGSPGPSTTSCARRGCGRPASAPAASTPGSRSGPAGRRATPSSRSMMIAEEVADVVLFTVTRPRGMRVLTTSFRPNSEPSWG